MPFNYSSVGKKQSLISMPTRIGKTRFGELLMPKNNYRGEVKIIIDPKGDVELLRRVHFGVNK